MIHPTALIDPKAELADDVEVGAFSIVDAKVRIDAGSIIGPHAVITGRTTIGKNNHIFQFTSIGEQLRTRNTRVRIPNSSWATTTLSVRCVHSVVAPHKVAVLPESAVTTG